MGLKEGDTVYAKLAMWHAEDMPKGKLVRGNAVDPPWPSGLVLVEPSGKEGSRVWCTTRSVLHSVPRNMHSARKAGTC